MRKRYIKLLFVFAIVLICNAKLTAQTYEVKGAGTEDVNGVYIPDGEKKGKTQYRKGEYILFYKGCHSKWMIKSPKGNFYRNKTDSETPPETGWEKGCGKGSMDPAPTVIIVAAKPKVEKQDKE